MAIRRVCVNVLWLMGLLALVAAAGAAPPAQLRGSVVDENRLPVSRVEVVVRAPGGQTLTAHTDEAGRFELPSLNAGESQVSLSKAGFFRLVGQPVQLREGLNEISFTLNHEFEVHEKVDVFSSSDRVEPEETAHQAALVAHEIRDIPVPSTHTLQSSLLALPGVLRDTSGQLHVAGARVGETLLLLDGFEIGDPATGNLSARVNVDTLRTVKVESGRYAAAYAHAGAGVLSLDTALGEDRWRFGTTNFIPSLSFERGTHLGNWYPRFTLSGPLRKGRAWFSDAVSLQHTFKLIPEQPPSADTITQWAGDNLLRLQLNLTPIHILQASFLYNQSSALHLGLGPFSPLSTTTDSAARRSFVSVKDQRWLRRVLLELGFAADIGRSEQLPQGPQTYVITPTGTAGNFFETVRQRAHRWQLIGNLIAPSRSWHGSHDLSAGLNVAATDFTHGAVRNAIESSARTPPSHSARPISGRPCSASPTRNSAPTCRTPGASHAPCWCSSACARTGIESSSMRCPSRG